jgi:hypothetical protein
LSFQLFLAFVQIRLYYHNVKPDDHGDSSDGYDGSRDSAYDINDYDIMAKTAANLQEIYRKSALIS